MSSEIIKASLEVDGVSVIYSNGHQALRDASFRLGAGTVCALVGVNGSGKSTLFKSIMGFVNPTAGAVRINGLPVREVLKKQLVAYVPQAEDVDWQFPVSVWDVVMMGRYGAMNFLRIPKAKDKLAVEESLKRVSMWEFKDRQIGELSGGQKKRVFLARALAQGGRVILLDEPFTGVDVKTEQAIIALLHELRKDGCIIFVSTHNLGSVPEFCDQVVLINRTVLAYGPTEEVFTAQNLSQAFGGVLREFEFEQSTIQAHDGRMVRVLSDDERPLVFGKDGHLEYMDRKKHEELLKQRSEEHDE
ncbi:MAG: ATP-binding cassette domain-containing protein [Akkermansiaceae bacterium]|jgi:manganese/iron transport system ATP-binding protein|nr:ATP-binding cassette domain-containing protein [Akkermansiaceae bacterium]MDP4646562.1 ATP-binding cassette domain-containing protein [Akkermansiaceae bacterium]MDP4720781.1 ATP-binding cassette domain-containing protein [Akkermansiaceae bacterium]MDP4781116.1 ATP-binding cassette domain-containing protein [Akkermansiaceae bacterium]MDP4846441.1 ATP-binding cassette domain-containing protein [Akkermansiaceae bacterium]